MLSGVRTLTVTDSCTVFPAEVETGANTVRRASTSRPVFAAAVLLPSVTVIS